jgi:hypothetical protein
MIESLIISSSSATRILLLVIVLLSRHQIKELSTIRAKIFLFIVDAYDIVRKEHHAPRIIAVE